MPLTDDQLKDITWALNALRERSAQFAEARRYYAGDHPLTFASDKFKSAFGTTFGALKINLCPLIVDTIAARLKLTGFSLKSSALKKAKSTKASRAQSDEVTAAAAEVWDMNRMKARWRDLAREALKCGEAYLIVWPDPEAENEPVWYPQKAGTCAVKYHEEKPGYVIQAAKWFKTDEGKARLTLYFRDRLEKYITADKSDGLPEKADKFVMYEAEGEEWPLPNQWDKCPVFHFPNGEDRVSELTNLIPAQNGMNKTACDQMVAMEFFAMPQRWGIGIEEEDDEESAAEAWKAAADRLWIADNDNAKFGQFDPSDPGAYLKVKADFRSDMAIIAGIPTYHFDMKSGDVPSGAALSILEGRLTEKVEGLQEYWGSPLADAMLLSLRMTKTVADGERVKEEWLDTTPKDPLVESQTQESKQRVGASKKQSLRELGYSDTRIEEMKAERAEEGADNSDTLGKMFSAGAV